MNSKPRSLRSPVDLVASYNEEATLALMRAAERTGDQILVQQLINVIRHFKQEATDLRQEFRNLELKRA